MRRFFNSVLSPLFFLIGLLFVVSLIFLMDGVYVPKNPSPLFRYGKSALLNIPDFKYIINNDVCSRESSPKYLNAVIIITSHVSNTHVRRAHRSALPSNTLSSIGVRRVFLLAVVKEGVYSEPYGVLNQNELDEENNQNGDIIQGSFNEAYRNLTYKHVMGLQWVSQFCQKAQYIIKMDDDIILDIYRLLKLIPKVTNASKSFIMGYVLKGIQPARNPKSKWFVTHKEYPKSYYPPFVSGWMYVTTPFVATAIVNYTVIANRGKYFKKLVPHRSFFWIDDVFLTGIVAQQIGVQLIDLSSYFAVHPQYFQCCVENAILQRSRKTNIMSDIHFCDYIVGPSGGDMQLLKQVLEDAEKCWNAEKHCHVDENRANSGKKCIVGRGEAYDWIRRPHNVGKATMKKVNL